MGSTCHKNLLFHSILQIVCHHWPRSVSLISLSLSFSSSKPAYSYHFLTSKEEGQAVSKGIRKSRKRINSGQSNELQTTTGSRREEWIFSSSAQKLALILNGSGRGGKVLVDVGGWRGGLYGKMPERATGCWPKLTHQLMYSQGHLLVSQSELKYPQVSKKSKKEDLTMLTSTLPSLILGSQHFHYRCYRSV